MKREDGIKSQKWRLLRQTQGEVRLVKRQLRGALEENRMLHKQVLQLETEKRNLLVPVTATDLIESYQLSNEDAKLRFRQTSTLYVITDTESGNKFAIPKDRAALRNLAGEVIDWREALQLSRQLEQSLQRLLVVANFDPRKVGKLVGVMFGFCLENDAFMVENPYDASHIMLRLECDASEIEHPLMQYLFWRTQVNGKWHLDFLLNISVLSSAFILLGEDSEEGMRSLKREFFKQWYQFYFGDR